MGNDKVGLSRLSVQVVSGLQLNISPDSVTENGYVAETSVTRKLTAQYQVRFYSNTKQENSNISSITGRFAGYRIRVLRR